MRKVAVVGSGVAGLSVAARLAHKGYDVKVYEKNSFVGGKCSTVQLGDFRFDRGPSLFTMPHYLEEVFSACGEKMSDFFEYHECDTHCQYFWEDGTVLKGKNKDFNNNVKSVFGVDISKFRSDNLKKFERTEEIFLNRSLHKASSYLFGGIFKSIAYLPKLGVFEKLDKHHQAKLKNPKLVQLFDRFATYNGSNPYETNAVMSLISSLELDYGTFFPKNGMSDITNSLYQLALKNGVQFKFEESVTSVQLTKNKVTSISTSKGEYQIDELVWASDVKTCYDLLAEPNENLSQGLSSSGGVFYWALDKVFDNIDLHNIIFSKNYRKEFDELFSDLVADDLTIYIHKASHMVDNMAPQGKEGWFIMVNVPSRDITEVEYTMIRAFVIERIKKVLGLDVESHILDETKMFPQDIESITGAFSGALYGKSSNEWHSSISRHPNFHKKIKNLKFCGGTVHPGGGIPLSLKSAKIVSEFYERV